MSASPRKKTFPTLHTAMECTSPPTATTPEVVAGGDSTSPPTISLQRESNNASPPTVPYTMDYMNTGINHIITEAMVREQLHGASPVNNNNNLLTTPTKENSLITEYESPSQRLLKGLTTTCDGSYGQQIISHHQSTMNNNIMESVPVEDVMRWKEFRRKQKIISKATEIDIDGFPVTEDLSTNADGSSQGGNGGDDDDNMILPKEPQLGIASSTSNSEVGTEIVSNTARYLAKQSNIMARQLMSSSEEGEEEEEENDDDDTEDWSTPMDVEEDWDTPLNEDGDEGQEERSSKVDDSGTQNSVEKVPAIDNEGEMLMSSSQSQQPLPQEEAGVASTTKKVVPTMDEVHNFMNQLKQKSAAGRERDRVSDDNNNTDLNSNSDIKLSSPSPKVAPHAITEGNDTNPLATAATTSSSLEVHKSLIEHRERMRQQKLEGQRKRQEFDARLQLLRSQLHDEAAGARLELLRSKLHDDADAADGLVAVPSDKKDDSVTTTAHGTIEKNINQQQRPVLPGARWSGGLAVWSPSNGGATMRSNPTPPKMVSSPSYHGISDTKQPQQHSTPVQLLPPTGIGIDEDDFSFSPVDVDAVLGKSSGSSSMLSRSGEMELFSEAYGGEAAKESEIRRASVAINDDEAKASTLKSPPSDVSPPISNGSTTVTEGDKGGGLGSGYLSGFGNKSMASSVNVELGFGTVGVDPPLDDGDCSEEEEENLLGVTVVGSKRRKKKSNTPRTSCETVEEYSKDGLKEDGSEIEDGGGGYRRDPSPVTLLEPTTKDAPFERKQVDPDGIDWKDIGIVQRDTHSTKPATPSRSVTMTIDANMEKVENDRMCPDNIFSPKNDNLPPVTPRLMTPQTRDGQWNLRNQSTPRSKRLPTPRATPRTARAGNLSSNRKFGFGDSPDTHFKINEKPSPRLDISADQSEMDAGIVGGDERDAEQVQDQANEERSPSNLSKPTEIEDIRSKFESNTFGLDHLHQSLQNIREEKAVEARQFKATLLDSPIKDSNTPSRIYLEDGDLRAMSSLETDTQASSYYSLSKGVSEDNDATIGDSTLGDGSMDTKKALRYARRLEHSHESEDNSKENHEEEATPSIVALRRKAFESQARGSIQKSPDHQNNRETKDKGSSLSNQRSLLNASKRHETNTREESRFDLRKPSQDHSSVSQSSPGGKTSVVASIKDRIAAYDGQKGKNGKPSLYRISNQSKTFQVRVGGQVKSINIRQGPNSIHTSGAVAEKEEILPSRDLNQHKQLPSPAANNSGAHNFQHGGAYSRKNEPSSNRDQATWSQNREMPRVAPIDTTYEHSTTLDDDDDGITLSPTISEVSGLTFETSLVAAGVVPAQEANEYERMLTPIARLRQRTQGNKFSYDHTDAPTPIRTSMETPRSSRRDQIVSRIRETSSNGNLWQRRNVVTEVSHSTSGDASGRSRNATIGYYSKSTSQSNVAEKVANIDGPRRSISGESENMSVGDRVAIMNRRTQKHNMRHRNSMNDDPGSSLATRDCIRVD